MKPFFDSNWPLQLRRGKINIYQHLQNTSARNNSIKMEIILFASLYRAKEILIFCVHFLEKNFLSTWRDRSGVPFLSYKKLQAAKIQRSLRTFSKPMYGTRPWCLVQAITRHTCPDPDLGSWNCLPYQAHIAPSEPMSSIDQQGSSLGSFPTFPSPLFSL